MELARQRVRLQRKLRLFPIHCQHLQFSWHQTNKQTARLNSVSNFLLFCLLAGLWWTHSDVVWSKKTSSDCCRNCVDGGRHSIRRIYADVITVFLPLFAPFKFHLTVALAQWRNISTRNRKNDRKRKREREREEKVETKFKKKQTNKKTSEIDSIDLLIVEERKGTHLFRSVMCTYWLCWRILHSWMMHSKYKLHLTYFKHSLFVFTINLTR